jgi:hypothetical protein
VTIRTVDCLNIWSFSYGLHIIVDRKLALKGSGRTLIVTAKFIEFTYRIPARGWF